jgi:hypothetical protein
MLRNALTVRLRVEMPHETCFFSDLTHTGESQKSFERGRVLPQLSRHS